ncbi:hypothetical protein D3C86_1731490 [compost metagenome]
MAAIDAKRGPLFDTLVNILKDLGPVLGGNNRTHIILLALGNTWSNAHFGNALCDSGHQLICDVVTHRDRNRERHAAFTCRAVGCAHDG